MFSLYGCVNSIVFYSSGPTRSNLLLEPTSTEQYGESHVRMTRDVCQETYIEFDSGTNQY